MTKLLKFILAPILRAGALTLFVGFGMLAVDWLAREGYRGFALAGLFLVAGVAIRFLFGDIVAAPNAIAAPLKIQPAPSATPTPSADIDGDWADIEIEIQQEKSHG